MRTLLSCLSAVVAAGALTAQSATHIVGPGGFPQVDAALAAAAPGDTILIQDGTYAPFTATIGVTIRAQNPGQARIELPANYTSPCNPFTCLNEGWTRLLAPAGEAVHVVGLQFWCNRVTMPNQNFVTHRVRVDGGIATFDGCEFQGQLYATCLTVAAGAQVNLQSCILIGGMFSGVAMAAGAARVTAIDTRLAGNSFPLGNTNDGVLLNGTEFQGSGLLVFGAGSQFGGPGGDAIVASGASRIWLRDSTVSGGNGSAGMEGCALVLGGTSTARLQRCTVTPNVGHCLVPATGPVLGVARNAALQRGATFTLTFATEPGWPVGAWFTWGLADRDLPILEQPWSVPEGANINAGFGIANALGAVSMSWVVPPDPALLDRAFWFHGLSGVAFPLQVAPPAGGVVR